MRAVATRLLSARLQFSRTTLPATLHFTLCPSIRTTHTAAPTINMSAAHSPSRSVLINSAKSNPLLESWSDQAFGLPPFERIQPAHFKSAFDVACAAHILELEAIAAQPAADATFTSVCVAFDSAGSLLDRVNKVFSNLCASCTTAPLQEVELELAGPLAAHENRIYTLPNLFALVDALHEQRASLNLAPEELQLLERQHLDFVRAGARFDSAAQKRYGAIMEQLAGLCTQFTQNVLADEEEFVITLALSDLSGCPADLVEAAKQAAVERHKGADEYVITLSRSLAVPFLTYATRRDLRERVFSAWSRRGELSAERDNRKLIREILRLRAEQAEMHGFTTYAEFATADTMAGSPSAVMQLLERCWAPATARANRERTELEAFAASTAAGEDTLHEPLQAWDWRFYAERLRQARYDFDEASLKPYLSLDRVTTAAFQCANQLFGLRYVPRPDLKSYHDDVKTFEVREIVCGVDRLVAVFLADNFARSGKRGGAWMTDLRSQSRNAIGGVGKLDATDSQRVVPVICNNNNFCKAPPGQSTLLSYDDGVTLFHEFGHGLHGTLSDARFQRLAGTNVLSDFVELPSQLYEHWFRAPRVMREHFLHVETNAAIPEALLERLKQARSFNAGFESTEYICSALLDQRLHSLTRAQLEERELDLGEFENAQLQALGMPSGMIARHRPAHFQHLFSGAQYASAYYVYLYAEVLDADAFDAFAQTGDVFDAATANRARQFIYSAGGTQPPATLFASFRGREPVIEPMLAKKGLL